MTELLWSSMLLKSQLLTLLSRPAPKQQNALTQSAQTGCGSGSGYSDCCPDGTGYLDDSRATLCNRFEHKTVEEKN